MAITVDSKAEKQAFLSNKIKDNGELEGSDPTGSTGIVMSPAEYENRRDVQKLA
jgi:hypothetical protein